MSEIQEIDVFVRPDGSVRLEVRGVKGGKCLDLTKDLEKLLGGEIVERIHTDEFAEQDQEEEATDLLEQRTE